GDQWQRFLGEHYAVFEKHHREEVKGGMDVRVAADHRQSVGGHYSLTVDRDRQEKVGTSYGLEAVQEMHLKSAMKVVREPGATLTIKGPGGFISIGPDGIVIQGSLVKINCGGAPGEGGSIDPTPAGFVQFEPRFGTAVDAPLQEPEPPAKADKS